MLFKRLAVTAAATLTLASPALPAVAADDPPPPKPGPGLYFSPWGNATFEFGEEFRTQLERAGAKIEGIHPVTVPDGTALQMPVGMKHDSVNLGLQIYYPGGWAISNAKTGASFSAAPFWLNVLQGGTNGKVTINGKLADENYKMASFFSPQALIPLASLAPTHNGFELKRFPMKLTDRWAGDLNRLFGTKLSAKDHYGFLSVKFKWLPLREKTAAPGRAA